MMTGYLNINLYYDERWEFKTARNQRFSTSKL